MNWKQWIVDLIGYQCPVKLNKLTIPQVKAIKRHLQTGEKEKDLAAWYGVSTGAIYDIKHGRSWAGV